LGRPVNVQVKLDYGFGRDGFRPEDLASATEALAQAVQAGHLRIRGLWSHFAMAGVPQDPNNKELVEFLLAFRDRLTELDVDYGLVHIANSDSLVFSPQYTFDMVRPGLFVYGFASVDNSHRPADLGIIPAMSFEAELANVKPLLPGEGVSYGYIWRSPGMGFLGVIPIGYADGVPRLLKNGQVYSPRTQKLYPIRGTICMDQCFVDLGNQTPPELVPGDRLEFWGQGPLLINDVAQAAGTTHVDLACGFGANLPRFYRNVDALGDLAEFYEFQRLD
jgi:alanine racemase